MALNPLRADPSFRTLPANRSLVVADSVYRDVSDETQSAYDFICKLNGGLEGKEIVYQKLYWNQPIFSHTNENCELLFQINGDTSVTYVVYATPYLLYTSYDGNPYGTSYLPPQPYSYASNMELAFNGDVRSLPLNATPIHGGSGILQDADGIEMFGQFRYSPSRGFQLGFQASTNPNIPVYTIRLLPCSYIEKAHYVHGFGVTSSTSPNTFIPRDMWTVCYNSDDTPSLLPFRYITIQSDELCKDRKMISFQNSSSPKHLNELAIFNLNSCFTGSYHMEMVGEDATVISKRDDYRPQQFRISILDEEGNVIQCDDPVKNVLMSPLVYEKVKQTFYNGLKLNRGNWVFTNYLLFGTPNGNIHSPTEAILHLKTDNKPISINTFWRNNSTVDTQNGLGNVFVQINWDTMSEFAFPIGTVTETRMPVLSGSTIGFRETISTATWWPETQSHSPPAAAIDQGIVYQTQFIWDPSVNPTPSITWDGVYNVIGYNNTSGIYTHATVINWVVGLWSHTRNTWVAAAALPQAFYGLPSYPPALGASMEFSSGDDPIVLTVNPNVGYIADGQVVSFFLLPCCKWGSGAGELNNAWCLEATFNFANPQQLMIIGVGTPDMAAKKQQHAYRSPVMTQQAYPFGDPQAKGLCEELIHEISVVTKSN